ncbi:MAG: cbb3-type cytochrome c oxidase subunit I, partial [Methylococcales bacterium]|nr:cbb3-type cytochrome c oxidase subunit I [Methylococcales bacterium]
MAVAALLGFLSALKLRFPGLGDDFPDPLHMSGLFGYGKLMPAHLVVLVYGWAMQAGIGVILWLMARLTRTPLRHPGFIVAAGHIWNLAVLIGVFSIIIGYGRSIPWLDFPAWLWPMLAISYVMITVWVIPMFRQRGASSVYISEKYLIAAVLWFPWIFITANILINRGTAPVMGAGIGAWYITNLIYFWMTPVALAVAYYIVPKIVGRPVFSYPLGTVAFWILAIVAGWTGFSRYMGGPFPAWMPAISGAASIVVVVAILISVVNLHMTFRGRMDLMKSSPSLRFTMFGM